MGSVFYAVAKSNCFRLEHVIRQSGNNFDLRCQISLEQNLKKKLTIHMAINLSRNQSFTLKNTKYFIDQFLDPNHIFARNYHKPDDTITLSSADIQCLLLKDDIVFHNNHKVPNCSKFDFTELPIELQDEAKRRADYAIAVMEATRFIRSTKEASKAIEKRFEKRRDK